MNRDDALNLLRNVDPASARSLVMSVAEELDSLSAQVWAFGAAEGSRRALAIVAQMGAELTVAACALFDLNRWYAGAALIRQLIEVEYLLFLFGNDAEEAKQWLNASPAEARSIFMPKNMRERSNGRFNSEEYSVHCEIGGHPRMKGHILLREHSAQKLFDPSVQWVDLAQHVERMWGNYIAAVKLNSPTNVYQDRFDKVNMQIAAWHKNDNLANKI